MESKFVSSIAPAPSPTLITFPASSDVATDRTIQSPAVKYPAPPTTPSTPLSAQDIRRWRPAAQRNLRNQWSKLGALRTQWFSLSSTARSYATSVVNSHLSQSDFYETAMPVYCLDSRDIVELQLKQKDCEILKRKKAALPQPPVAMAPPSVQQGFYQPQLPPASAPAPAAPAAPALPPPAPSKPKSSHPPMKCPMAGTFYRSPTPGAPPFVKVAVVTQMVNVSKSMRCYRKGSNGSALAEFSLFPGDQNDTGDSDGIPVFTFWSIFDFEKLALELVQMFVSEMNIKRLLVMEICSIGSEEFSQVDRLKWSDHFYVGEFEDLLKCNSNSNEVLNQLVPRLESCNSRTFPMQSSNQLESNILQVYLTTWLAEVNVDRFRIGE